MSTIERAKEMFVEDNVMENVVKHLECKTYVILQKLIGSYVKNELTMVEAFDKDK